MRDDIQNGRRYLMKSFNTSIVNHCQIPCERIEVYCHFDHMLLKFSDSQCIDDCGNLTANMLLFETRFFLQNAP